MQRKWKIEKYKDKSRNQIENKEKLERINKAKSWVFRMTTKLIIPWKDKSRLKEEKQK